MPNRNDSPKKTRVAGETRVFVEQVKCHEEPNLKLDLEGADKYGTEGERLISNEPPVISVLMAQKKQSRISKGMAFNCFVIDRSRFDEQLRKDELEIFLEKLRERHMEGSLPNPTRFQIVVYDGGHWYPVDFYIKDDVVKSFILDAAGDIHYEEALQAIQNAFPDGEHYQFHIELELKENAQNKHVSELLDSRGTISSKYYNLSSMQKSGAACGIFSSYHAMNISRANPEEFYDSLENSSVDEVRTIPGFTSADDVVSNLYAVKPVTRAVTLNSMQPNEDLVRLIRPTQSYTQLDALADEVKSLEISTGKGNTSLSEHAERSREEVGGRNVNATVLNKSQTYRKKILDFKSLYSDAEMEEFMAHRAGFSYLETPDLFSLDKRLSRSEKDDILQVARGFTENINMTLPTNILENILTFRLQIKNLRTTQQILSKINELINDFEEDDITKGEFVALFLLQVQELQDTLLEENNLEAISAFKDAVLEAAHDSNVYIPRSNI